MSRSQLSTPLLVEEHFSGANWTSLLDAIGTDQFEPALKRFVTCLVGGDGCATFFHEGLGEVVLGCGRKACGCLGQDDRRASPHWIHFDDGPWHAAIVVTVSRDLDWPESSELSRRIASAGGALSAILRKHMGDASNVKMTKAVESRAKSDVAGIRAILRNRIEAQEFSDDECEPLHSLNTIERCLANRTTLPNRELEVCSRILHGLSSTAIAIDLNLCDSTVKTYRKRVYQRLSIGSERELLTWYLSEWSRWIREPGRTGAQSLEARNNVHAA